ncbi:MAG: hypothetical protein DCO96_00470 [Fluviicola sp. XM-24bin1]|nr:MAG: hypothetical protein DCO96_00470 [Fluviicola sp. XM-24bin1]
MKKSIYVFALLSALFLVACENNKSDDSTGEKTEMEADASSIVGEWKLSDLDTGMEVPDEARASAEAVVEEMKEKSSMTFNEDGTYVSRQAAQGRVTTETGMYEIEDGKIVTTSEQGNRQVLDIDLGEDSFTLRAKNGDSEMKLTYTRK